MVALGIAILRGLPGPVFFPLRALAVVYADFFRGVPTILVIYILGFGAPALQISGVPTDPLFWGITALVLVYSAYVSEVYRAGIESVHPSQEAAARSLGLSRAKALRFVVLPQAVRRVMPPLLNDFIGLQKDTALVALLGPVEAFRQSQIEVAATFNYTPYLVTALLFVLLTVPMARLTDWLVARDRRRQLAAGGRTVTCRSRAPGRGAAQVVRQGRGAQGHRSHARAPRRRLPHRRLRVREVDAAALRQPARADRRREDRPGRRRDHRAPSRPEPVRRRIGIVFQSFNLFPHMSVLRNVTLGPTRALGVSRDQAEADARELLGRFGLAERAGEYPDRLSGGQQQRVAIVRALAMRPELMLLDEVTSALDPELVAEVLSVIRELAESGMTMLIATHEMSFARDIADRVCFLDAGVILEQGDPEQIFTAPTEPRTQQFLQRIIEAGRL